MKTLTKSGIRELTAKYRSVLKKCAILNAMVLILGASSAMADVPKVNTWSGLKSAVAGSAETINVTGDITYDETEAIQAINRTLSIIGYDADTEQTANRILDGKFSDTSQINGLTVGSDGNLTLTNITMKNFKNSANGGAILNYGTIKSIMGDFIGNSTNKSDSAAHGGAINNQGTIGSITGDFKDNKSSDNGGAILNGGTIKSITGDFIGNSAKNGGAIYNNINREINFVADGSDITFDGNYVTAGNGGAIYNAVSATTKGIVGLYADTRHSITFIGDKTTQTLQGDPKDIDGIYNLGDLNINGSYNGKMYTGTVNLYNVSDYSTPMGTTNIYGGTVNVAKDITQKAITIAADATLTTKGNVTTTDGIANTGTLNLLGGTSTTRAIIDSTVSGGGTTNFGNGTDNTYIQLNGAINQAINIKAKSDVLTSADNVGGAVANAGTLTLTGGALNKAITGGKVTIDDDVTSNASIAADIIINDGKKLTNNGTVSVYGIKGEIQNNEGGSITFNTTGNEVNINFTNLGTVNFNGELNSPNLVYNLTQNDGIMNFSTTALETSADHPIDAFTMNGGSVNIADGSVNTLHIHQLNLSGDTNFALDADLAAESMDKIQIHDISGSEIAEGKVINIDRINLLSATEKDKVSLDLFADPETKELLKDNVFGNLSGLEYSPTYIYDAKYSTDDGTITFTRTEQANPYLYAPSIMAQTTASITGQIAGLAMDKLDAAVGSGEKGLAGGDMPKANNAWVKVMGFDDDVDFKHFNSVDSKTYTLAGGFNTDKVKFDNFDAGFGIYGGYIGGKQKYNSSKIEQDGGYVGLSSELTKGNAFLLSTINTGFINNEDENMYGTDKFDTRWFGIGLKGGYNYAINDTWTLQPNIYAGYTLVNTEDYTSKSGVRINNDNLNFFEIDPGFRLSKQIDNGWLGYIQGKYAIVMDNGGETTFNDNVLPNISAKNYFEYGFGMNKSLTDTWSLNGEINRRDGGRTGWNGSVEFKYHF